MLLSRVLVMSSFSCRLLQMCFDCIELIAARLMSPSATGQGPPRQLQQQLLQLLPLLHHNRSITSAAQSSTSGPTRLGGNRFQLDA